MSEAIEIYKADHATLAKQSYRSAVSWRLWCESSNFEDAYLDAAQHKNHWCFYVCPSLWERLVIWSSEQISRLNSTPADIHWLG